MSIYSCQAHHKFMVDCICCETAKEFTDLQFENARLRKALTLLVKESAALIRTHELVLSMDHGNSNMRCLQICIDKARAALEGGE